jgi:transaldolase
MIEEGRCIFAFSARTIVKVPIEREGLIAIKQLQADKIPVLGTSIVSASQALLAFHHKVSYMAPYFSHAPDPQGLLKAMVDMVNASRSSTKIMSAALKEIDHVLYAAALGAAAVTIKADLYYQLMGTHPIAEGFLQKFMQDWQERQGGVSLCKML